MAVKYVVHIWTWNPAEKFENSAACAGVGVPGNSSKGIGKRLNILGE